jgi:hypothetical protein
MRHVEKIGGTAPAANARRARRFEDALRGAAEARSGGSGSRAPAWPAASGPARARRVSPPNAERPAGEDRRGRAPDVACPGAPPPLAPQAALAALQAPPELRALVRALPIAVETFGVARGAPLALSFGRALEVELRSVAGGIELVLRADSRLARACAAGMPGLVAALERRGISVVRAEVRGRRDGGPCGTGGGRRPPFVDLPVPLR